MILHLVIFVSIENAVKMTFIWLFMSILHHLTPVFHLNPRLLVCRTAHWASEQLYTPIKPLQDLNQKQLLLNAKCSVGLTLSGVQRHVPLSFCLGRVPNRDSVPRCCQCHLKLQIEVICGGLQMLWSWHLKYTTYCNTYCIIGLHSPLNYGKYFIN